MNCGDEVQPEATQVPYPTSSHQDFIMALMLGQKNDSRLKTVLFACFLKRLKRLKNT